MSMSSIIYWTLFVLSGLGLAACLIGAIWTGDIRWFATAWIPGVLTIVLFCVVPFFSDDL